MGRSRDTENGSRAVRKQRATSEEMKTTRLECDDREMGVFDWRKLIESALYVERIGPRESEEIIKKEQAGLTD
jgi:hypothetical protein